MPRGVLLRVRREGRERGDEGSVWGRGKRERWSRSARFVSDAATHRLATRSTLGEGPGWYGAVDTGHRPRIDVPQRVVSNPFSSPRTEHLGTISGPSRDPLASRRRFDKEMPRVTCADAREHVERAGWLCI